MNTLENIRTFVAVAQAESFSEAARRLGISPSVVTKRVGQLEHQMRARLFHRSTRRVLMTDAGEQCLPRYQKILREVDLALAGEDGEKGLRGTLRIKAPRAFDVGLLVDVLGDFQAANPNLTLDVMLLDHSLDPAGERYDLGLGILAPIYWNVTVEPLRPYQRVCCAAPSYLAQHGLPDHPRDLTGHDCLTYHTIGPTWSFTTVHGEVRVDVRSRFSSNDTEVLHRMACNGHGVVVLARHLADRSLREGRLVEVLPGYPLVEMWLKALIPNDRLHNRNVQALLAFLKERLGPATQ